MRETLPLSQPAPSEQHGESGQDLVDHDSAWVRAEAASLDMEDALRAKALKESKQRELKQRKNSGFFLGPETDEIEESIRYREGVEQRARNRADLAAEEAGREFDSQQN